MPTPSPRTSRSRGVEALEVTEAASGVEVRVRAEAGEEVLRADGCVLATMLEQSAVIHASTAETTAEMRSRPRMVDLIKAQLGYSTDTRTPGVLGMFLGHNKHRDRAAAGNSLLTVYTDSPTATAWMDRPEEELVAWVGRRWSWSRPCSAGTCASPR